jgi:SAM-dependent methyltransferase
MNSVEPTVLPHHREAAAMWGQGGAQYDDVSFAISDALAHAAQRLNAKSGERILDIATGTGWSARNAARGGASVTAVDIAEPLLAAARALSAHLRPAIDFRLADAEQLPFADAGFDGVISTFGVMFAEDQRRAAAEMARVCRPSGRLVLATWTPDGAVAAFFGLLGRYMDAPPPSSSPLAWGDPAHVEALLGDAFALRFEPGVNHAYHDSPEEIWAWYVRGFGPLRMLAETLDAGRLEALRREVDAYHRHYAVPAGLKVSRDYLITIGRRR